MNKVIYDQAAATATAESFAVGCGGSSGSSFGLSYWAGGWGFGGSYPSPTVVGLSHVTAGGDLTGTMDAPVVNSIANVTRGPAVYPAGDGSLLTGLPPQKVVVSGRATLAGGEQNVILGFTPDPPNQMGFAATISRNIHYPLPASCRHRSTTTPHKAGA